MSKFDSNYPQIGTPEGIDRLWGLDISEGVNGAVSIDQIYALVKGKLASGEIAALTARVEQLELATKAYRCSPSGTATEQWSKIFETPPLDGINHYSFQALYSSGQPEATYPIHNGRLAVYFIAGADGIIQPAETRVRMYDEGVLDGDIVLQQAATKEVSVWIRRPNWHQRPEFTVPQTGGATQRGWFIDNAGWQDSLPVVASPGAQYDGVKAVL